MNFHCAYEVGEFFISTGGPLYVVEQIMYLLKIERYFSSELHKKWSISTHVQNEIGIDALDFIEKIEL